MGCGANGKSVAEFRSLLDEAEHAAEALRGDLQYERQQGERLRSELAAVCKEHIASRQEIASKQRELDELRVLVRTLEERLAASTASVRTEITRRSRLDSRCSTLEVKLYTMSEELHSECSEAMAESRASRNMEAEAVSRNQEFVELHANALRITSECESLQAACDAAVAELREQAELHAVVCELEAPADPQSMHACTARKARHSSTTSLVTTAAGGPGSCLKDTASSEIVAAQQETAFVLNRGGPGRKLRVSKRTVRRNTPQRKGLDAAHIVAVDEGAAQFRGALPMPPGSDGIVPMDALPGQRHAAQSMLLSAWCAASPPEATPSASQILPASRSPWRPQCPALHQDPSAQVFQFDFSVFDFLKHKDFGRHFERESEVGDVNGAHVTPMLAAEQHRGAVTPALVRSTPPAPQTATSPHIGDASSGLRLGAVAAAPLLLPFMHVGKQKPPPQERMVVAMKCSEENREVCGRSTSGTGNEEDIWSPVDAHGQPLPTTSGDANSGGESLADDDWPMVRR